jgi:Putative beta-barrel porin-2, OmpL-like. bbp2
LLKKIINIANLLACLFFSHQALSEVSGYVDGSYNYLVQQNTFVSGIFDRFYDVQQRGFTLHQVGLTFEDLPKEGLGGVVNLIGGHDVKIFEPYGWPSIFNAQTVQFDIPQAYLQYTKDKWTVVAGELFTLAGAEVIDATTNINFSRSILDGYAEPFIILGARSTYAWDDAIRLLIGVNDGWDTITDVSKGQTIELGVIYNPSKDMFISALLYSGYQRAVDYTSSGPVGIRNIFNFLTNINITEKLNFIVSYDYGNQTLATVPAGHVDVTQNSEAIWQGISGYINYKINDVTLVSFRGEIFADVDGYRTGEVQTWSEITFSIKYNLTKDLFIRSEIRHDFSNFNVFNGNNGVPANYQQSYALEMGYNIF